MSKTKQLHYELIFSCWFPKKYSENFSSEDIEMIDLMYFSIKKVTVLSFYNATYSNFQIIN